MGVEPPLNDRLHLLPVYLRRLRYIGTMYGLVVVHYRDGVTSCLESASFTLLPSSVCLQRCLQRCFYVDMLTSIITKARLILSNCSHLYHYRDNASNRIIDFGLHLVILPCDYCSCRVRVLHFSLFVSRVSSIVVRAHLMFH